MVHVLEREYLKDQLSKIGPKTTSLDPAETEEFEEQIVNERNYTDLTNLGEAAIRFEVSDTAAAETATAILIDYGIVTKNKKSQIITG